VEARLPEWARIIDTAEPHALVEPGPGRGTRNETLVLASRFAGDPD
jgi:hypothetical protein